MRILGFSKEWKKLNSGQFTTFRFKRKDLDWSVGETVQVVLHQRSPKRHILGIAQIIRKEARRITAAPLLSKSKIPIVSSTEAQDDGFTNWASMYMCLWSLYRSRLHSEPMNKLTLKWIERRPL